MRRKHLLLEIGVGVGLGLVVLSQILDQDWLWVAGLSLILICALIRQLRHPADE